MIFLAESSDSFRAGEFLEGEMGNLKLISSAAAVCCALAGINGTTAADLAARPYTKAPPATKY
jgi:hypothetical protein